MKELICICCPLGCKLYYNEETSEVSGYGCLRGKNYCISEVTSPKRMVTSICKVINGEINVCSVKTTEPIDKDKIFDCLSEIEKVSVNSPIEVGQVIIENVLNTGSNIIATKTVLEDKNE